MFNMDSRLAIVKSVVDSADSVIESANSTADSASKPLKIGLWVRALRLELGRVMCHDLYLAIDHPGCCVSLKPMHEARDGGQGR